MPQNEIVVRLRIGGVDQVEQGLRSVQQAAERAERGTKRQYENESKAAQRAERDKIRLREAGYRENARLAADEIKATEKAEKDKLKAREKSAKEGERAEERRFREVEKWAASEVRAVEKAEREKAAIREKHARAIASSATRSVGRLASGAINLAGTAATLGGGFGVADAIQTQFAAQRAAQQLINATTISGPDSRANMQGIMSRAGAIAIKSGMSQEEIIKGALSYSRSARGGDIGGALDNMEFFTKLSKVSGTSIEDLGGAAGILQSQNADLGKHPELMRQALLNAYAQTGSGSVSLVQAAKQFGVLGSTRGLFQGNEAQNQMTLMGLGQIAAAGGSSEEIGTYIKDFSMETAQKRRHTSKELGFGGRGLEALGVHFDKTGRMESPEQAIGAIFKATGGDLGQIGGLVGKRGIPLFSELQKSFLGAGGGDAGVAAVTKQIHDVTQSTMSEGSLDKKFDETMSSPAEKLGKTFEELREKVGEALMPEMQKLAEKAPELVTSFVAIVEGAVQLADWFLKNPFEGIGLIVLGAVVKDIAAAAIGTAIKNAITGSMGGGGFGGGGGGSGGGGVVNGAAAGAGWMAAVVGAGHLADAASSAYSAHESGRNWAGTAHEYLDKWQSGSASWIGGAKWNPLVTLAKETAGYFSDAGKIEATDSDDVNARAAAVHRGTGKPGTGWDAEHHTSYGIGGAPPKPVDKTDTMIDVLKQIATNTKSGGASDPKNPNRNGPIGDRSGQ